MILIEYNPVRAVWVRCFRCGIWRNTASGLIKCDSHLWMHARIYCAPCARKLEREEGESQTQSSR